MTDVERLAALRQVRESGIAPEALRRALEGEGLTRIAGGQMLRWLRCELTDQGECALLTLGAAEVANKCLRLWSNGTDTVVASSPDDATAAYVELTGASPLDDDGVCEWVVVDESKVIPINMDDGAGDKVTRTAAEWAVWNGRGFLCSTEC